MEDTSNKFPKVTVKAIFRCGDKVLFYRTKNGIQDIPGGHIKFGEKILEALKRELIEEIGFKLEIEPKLLHAWTYISRSSLAHRVYIGYLIDIPETKQFESKEFGKDIEFIWIDKDEIKNQHFLPEIEEVLLKAFNSFK